MSVLDLELANGRGWTTLGEQFEVTRKPRGLVVSSLPTIPFAAMEAIPDGGAFEPTYTDKAPELITSGTYFERGDLLIAKITPSFENGKQALTTSLSAPFGYATTEVIPIRPKAENQDPRFLFYYLLHPDIRSFVAERMEGTTGRQRVPDEVLLALPMPELQREDQSTVADALSLVRSAVEAEGYCLGRLRELKQSALRRLFVRGARAEPQRDSEVGPIPRSWKVEALSLHFSVGSGGTPSRGVDEYWSGGTIPWVKTAEIDYSTIQSTGEKITPAGLANSAARLYEPGTLMMAMYGQGVTRGRVALLGIQAACNQACAAIAPLDDAVDIRYLYHFLTYRYAEMRNLAHGGQQQNLNMDIVKALPIAFPPDGASSEEQQEIVAILEAIDRKIDLHKRKRAVLEQLFQTLLHKLMTGEIKVADLDLSALPAPAAVGV